jgi:hypothetical protein
VRGGDESTITRCPGEHDVTRFVADKQRARDARLTGYIYDAYAIGQVIDDPNF